jgi:hypothetical protein
MFQDGLLRVLLDGGPTRGFAQSDSAMLEEDVNVLKVCGFRIYSVICS